ncbi:MAG: SCO family protein [Sphaerobacter sp.]|nr:SCO family protein [Sphaerobacter sp.]
MARAGLLYSAILVVTVVIVALAAFRPIRVLPRIAPAPGFALTDQEGQRLTSEDLRGKIVLYDFTYLSCPSPCARTTEVMRQVQERLAREPAAEPEVRLITISFDPERDSPAALRAAAEAAGADPARWRFATGAPELMKLIVGAGFNVFYERNPDGSFRFDPTLVLVDGWGIVRAEYRVGPPPAEQIVNDIRLVANEARRSRGPARLAYEATHLFVCNVR